MGFWSSIIGSTVSGSLSSSVASAITKSAKETTNTELKEKHGFKDFEKYKSELKTFSLEIEDESTDNIANLSNKAAVKND